MGLKVKNVNIMGVHQFLGVGLGSQKSNIYGELPKKWGLGQFAGGLAKNMEEGVLLRWLIPQCTL